MGVVIAVDELDPRLDRYHTGGTAGDPALPLFDLRDGAATRRVLCRASGDGLGVGHGDLRVDPAPGNGGRGVGLDSRLHPLADQCGVLPSVDPSQLAAAHRLGVAVDLRIRGYAGGAIYGHLSRRLSSQCAGAQRTLRDTRRCRLSLRLSRRPPAWCATTDGRVTEKAQLGPLTLASAKVAIPL